MKGTLEKITAWLCRYINGRYWLRLVLPPLDDVRISERSCIMNFTAVIETDIFVIEVMANIDECGITVLEVYFGDDPITHGQMLHFIKSYGEADLNDEIMSQYRSEKAALEADMAGEDWERGVA